MLDEFYQNLGGIEPAKIIMFRDGVSEGQFQEVQEIPFFSHQRKVRVSNRKNEANMINIQNGKSQLTAFRLIFLCQLN